MSDKPIQLRVYRGSIVGANKNAPFMTVDDEDCKYQVDQFKACLTALANQYSKNIKVDLLNVFPKIIDTSIYKKEVYHEIIVVHPFSYPNQLTAKSSSRLPEQIEFNGNSYSIKGNQRDLLNVDFNGDKGKIVRDSANNILVYFFGHHIYFMFDVLDVEYDGDLTDTMNLFIDLLDTCIQHAAESGMLVDSNAFEQERYQKSYETFMQRGPEIARGVSRSIDNEIRQNVEDYERVIAQLGPIHERIIESQEKKRRLEANYDLQSIFGNEKFFKNLLNYYYENIECVSDHDNSAIVKARTRDIFIKYENRVYEIGKMVVKIPFHVGRPITIVNTDPKTVNGSVLQHPHILGSTVCYGNIKDNVLKLRQQNQYMILLQVLAQYLFQYNKGDAYNKIELFKVVEDFDMQELIYDNDAAAEGLPQPREEDLIVEAEITRVEARREEAVQEPLPDLVPDATVEEIVEEVVEELVEEVEAIND